jgi:hypothetical protein
MRGILGTAATAVREKSSSSENKIKTRELTWGWRKGYFYQGLRFWFNFLYNLNCSSIATRILQLYENSLT